MRIFLFFLLFSSLFITDSSAQVLPLEGSTLHYCIIPFTFPTVKSSNYKIRIAEGNFNSDDVFRKNVIKTVNSKKNKLIIEIPGFGKQYTWCVTTPEMPKPVFYHFSVATMSLVDTVKTRLSIKLGAAKYRDDYVFVDGSRVLYDMQGNPVWYLPNFEGMIRNNTAVRDIKLSCKNTITFMFEGEAWEINYNGDILWKGPNGRHQVQADTLEGYHHELTRLSNGNYMLLGLEPIARPQRDSLHFRTSIDSAGRRKVPNRKARCGTIVEYNEKGNMVWHWNSARYLDTIDPALLRKPNVRPANDAHENSFFFDEKNKCVYLSFRNINQVIRISYPDGAVLNVYGNSTDSANVFWDTLFCGQHSCNISSDGYLYLFDNGCDISMPPKVIILKQPLSHKDTMKEIWQYSCPVTPVKVDMAQFAGRLMPFTTGGNVIELSGHDMFVSTCNPYSELFIVSENKKLLWDAALEKRGQGAEIWQPSVLYRASIITRQQLESLIWSGVSSK